MRGVKGEVSPSCMVPPLFCRASWSGQTERKSMASAMGEEGPHRRASMSSRPNRELVIIVVMVTVGGHESSV